MIFFSGHASRYWNRLSLSKVMLFHRKYAKIYVEMTRSLDPCWLFVPSSRSFENSSVLPIIVTEENLTGCQACKAIYSWRKFNTGGVDWSRAQTQSDSWNIMQIVIRVCFDLLENKSRRATLVSQCNTRKRIFFNWTVIRTRSAHCILLQVPRD